MKLVIALVAIVTATPALAQYDGKTFYGTNGSPVGSSITSSSGQTTFYGSKGEIVGKSQPLSGGTTVIYDGKGNRIGTVSDYGHKK